MMEKSLEEKFKLKPLNKKPRGIINDQIDNLYKARM